MAGGVDVASQNFGERGTAFLSGIPGLDDAGDFIEPGSHVHATAGTDDDDDVLVFRGDLLDEFVLSGRKFEGTVPAFGFALRIESDGDYDCLSFGGQLFDGGLNPIALRNNPHANERRAETLSRVVLRDNFWW